MNKPYSLSLPVSFIYLSPVSLQLLPTFELSKIVKIDIAITKKAWINT